ncbi:MAG: hypothetical protein RL660_918 [Bacteroidota bacterium]|jgi:hypothetical protein
MGFFDNIFAQRSKTKREPSVPLVQFGHYSDNNKSKQQIENWSKAEGLFHDGKYISCAEEFLQYIQDAGMSNVTYKRTGNTLDFEIIQGSKRIHGACNDDGLKAWCQIASMQAPSTPAMRRLLELNYAMSYSRFALKDDVLHIVMDCTDDMMHPNKLYYGLRELCLQADLQDDILLSNFSNMQQVESDHVMHNTDQQKEIKYAYFLKCIDESLSIVEPLNPDTFSVTISYIYINLLQKLHYLLVPEGKLLEEIDRITNKYWSELEKKTSVELNQMLQKNLIALRALPKQNIIDNLYYTNGTFCRMPPPDLNKVQEVIGNCLVSMAHYRDSQQHNIANLIMEYCLTNTAYHNSMPQCLRRFVAVFMQVNHSAYCQDLGLPTVLYNVEHGTFSKTEIANLLKEAVDSDIHRFPNLKFDSAALRYDNLVTFNQSFLEQLIKIDYSA